MPWINSNATQGTASPVTGTATRTPTATTVRTSPRAASTLSANPNSSDAPWPENVYLTAGCATRNTIAAYIRNWVPIPQTRIPNIANRRTVAGTKPLVPMGLHVPIWTSSVMESWEVVQATATNGSFAGINRSLVIGCSALTDANPHLKVCSWNSIFVAVVNNVLLI